jgi:hypothetical protein
MPSKLRIIIGLYNRHYGLNKLNKAGLKVSIELITSLLTIVKKLYA